MTLKHEKRNMMLAGLVIGVIASLLVLFGNPKNMGFCIACFLRDTAGALGLHSAEAVQYIRPEIIGLVFGSFLMALAKKRIFPARRQRACHALCARHVCHDRKPDVPGLPVPHDSQTCGRRSERAAGFRRLCLRYLNRRVLPQ